MSVGAPAPGFGRRVISLRGEEESVSTTNGTAGRPAPRSSASTPRVPRRLVLLKDGEDSDVERVLAEYTGTEAGGRGVHGDVQRIAGEHRGRCVAAEWLGPLGWTRFLWCRKA
jgi:hypothetical protein